MITTAYIKAGAPTNEWQRPSDWIAIPSIASGEQVFYGLVAVYNVVGGNRVAFTFAGNYTVDWGDGTPLENVLSGVKAEHSYDYSTVSNPTSEGFRQALIKVIPTGVANITTVNLQQTPTGISAGRTSQFIDIVMNVPNVTGASTNLVIGVGTTVFHRIVERIWIKDIGAITNMVSMFQNCSSLQSLPLFNTSSVTTMSQMFNGCVSLQTVPLFNTINVTNTQQMFFGCNLLESVPLFNTINVTNMQQMFNSCFSLKSVPLFNTINVTNMQQMFVSCITLKSVPLFNTSNVSNMLQMFFGCTLLESVPLFNTINVTNMAQMFQSCIVLKSVPSFNTVNVTNMSQMFVGAISIYEVELNMSSVTTTTQIFLNAFSIQRFIATGLTRGIAINANLLSATEINNFFTSLGTASGIQTIVVTGNPGASTCDVTIATAKGFIVTI
jgi:surface protein